MASQVALVVKNPPANAGDKREVGSIPAGGKMPLEEDLATQATPVFLPGKSHGRRILAGYSPEWNRSDLAHVSEKSPRAPSSVQLGSLPGVPYPLSLESVLFSRVRLSCYLMELSRLLCPWDFPGKNTGVGCHFLLQGISPT